MKVFVTAILCLIVAVTFAPTPRAQDAGGAPAGPPQNTNMPLTRFAYIDGPALVEKGIKLDKDDAALADLKAFGEALKVKVIDVGKLQGMVFITDNRLDVTEAFLAARKARRSKSEPFDVSGVSVPSTTIAFIDTEAFIEPKTGINKLVKAFQTVEAEFKPRRDEIQKLREQVNAGSGDKKRLEGEIKRKQEEGQKEIDKRIAELTGSIYQDIGNSLAPFCKKRGISLLFDVSKVRRYDRLPPLSVSFPPDTPDVTAVFVSAYNSGTLLDNILIP